MARPSGMTLADLVVLSMLSERSMHGYELWAELERRQVEKWASISRAQVYYSLRKLADSRHIVSARDSDSSLGPASCLQAKRIRATPACRFAGPSPMVDAASA